MCAYDGDEPADVWNETRPRARKEHRCEECGGAIPKGVFYRRVAVLGDGHWTTYRVHLECAELAHLLGDLMCDGNAAIGQMLEHLSESGIECEPPEIDDALVIYAHVPVPLPTLRDVGVVRAAWRGIREKYGVSGWA